MPFVPPSSSWINRLARLNERLTVEGGLPLGAPWRGHDAPGVTWTCGDTSDAVAEWLGWPADWHATAAEAQLPQAVFSGQDTWPGMQPLTTVYSGHQFGQWAGQLGDGRAVLLGEFAAPSGGLEVQLKGAGLTPFSRRGDGRAVLRSSIREYLCSEAMHALGIPTSRALCLLTSSMPVWRETPETAAIVTRVASSFIRFGHFEHFAYRNSPGARDSLEALVLFVLKTHVMPEDPAHIDQLDPAERALMLLTHACTTTADLMAQWQSVGFCHGVMNTDNMSILGLTIDYGPFGFMDAFDPDHVCNHSDSAGRYRWRAQPDVAWWNLGALAQALSVSMPGAQDEHSDMHQTLINTLHSYEPRYKAQMLMRWQAKLGLQTSRPEDEALVNDWLALMARGHVDFTIAFRRLGQWRSQQPPAGPDNTQVRDLFLDRAALDAWGERYNQRLVAESSVDEERSQRMSLVNPWVVLRNHLAQRAIEQAQTGDFAEVKRLRLALEQPFTEHPAHAHYADFPPDWASSLEVSCSS
jgi:serine/tyrosine/threonine adenylyltransferase